MLGCRLQASSDACMKDLFLSSRLVWKTRIFTCAKLCFFLATDIAFSVGLASV